MIGIVVFFLMIISIIGIIQPELIWLKRDDDKKLVDTELSGILIIITRISSIIILIFIIIYALSSCSIDVLKG